MRQEACPLFSRAPLPRTVTGTSPRGGNQRDTSGRFLLHLAAWLLATSTSGLITESPQAMVQMSSPCSRQPGCGACLSPPPALQAEPSTLSGVCHPAAAARDREGGCLLRLDVLPSPPVPSLPPDLPDRLYWEAAGVGVHQREGVAATDDRSTVSLTLLCSRDFTTDPYYGVGVFGSF